jgi:hypothetical protein
LLVLLTNVAEAMGLVPVLVSFFVTETNAERNGLKEEGFVLAPWWAGSVAMGRPQWQQMCRRQAAPLMAARKGEEEVRDKGYPQQTHPL